MYILPVICNQNSAIAYLGVEEGNISLNSGIRAIVQFQNGDRQIIERRLFKLEGDDFQQWFSNPGSSRDELVLRILAWAHCIANTLQP